MLEIETINFKDSSSKENTFIFVYINKNDVHIGLCQEENGDMDIFLTVPDCHKFIAALQKAVTLIESTEE